LHAERVDDEDERPVELVERVEVNLDVVVGADPVAVGEGVSDRPVGLERPNAEIDGGGRIPDADFGRIGRGALVDGLIL
jgi:hypothetical protein